MTQLETLKHVNLTVYRLAVVENSRVDQLMRQRISNKSFILCSTGQSGSNKMPKNCSTICGKSRR